MKTTSSRYAKANVTRALTAAALTFGCISAWALPAFTLNPSGAFPALSGGKVTADNITVSSYAHAVTDAVTQTFTETGLLSVQSFQLGGTVVPSLGLNSTYGLYIDFSATGKLVLPGNPLVDPTYGTFTSLTYTLFGYNGPSATFSIDGAHVPSTTATGAVALATGVLIDGSVGTRPAKTITNSLSFVPSADATVTFTPEPAAAGFFKAPTSFYSLAIAAFTNPVSTVQVISPTEFVVRQGGGAFNFAATPVPEPETYALLMAGLTAIGFVVNRRKS